MKLVVVKSSFQVLLVPNWRVFRITVIYVSVVTAANYESLSCDYLIM